MTSCSAPSSDSGTPAKSKVEQQFARGAAAYGQNCAACHGAAGEGTSQAPRLVGKGSFPLAAGPGRQRPGEFRTALDVANFVVSSMPPSAKMREQIPVEDYWAVLAFALTANGVELQQVLDAEVAGSIVLNP